MDGGFAAYQDLVKWYSRAKGELETFIGGRDAPWIGAEGFP